MKKIYGRVLVKETNTGIPDLVVTVFDSESEYEDILRHRGGEFTSQFIERLGKRIGSMLTDKEGSFLLDTADLEFTGNVPRPDLLLIIFAPEDSLKIDQPYSLPPEKRLLHITRIPRVNAGAEEAFIIRLLTSQLKKFKIPSGMSVLSPKEGKTDSHNYFNSIERQWIFRDSLKDKLKPRIKAQLDRNIKFRTLAKDKLKNFSTIPQSLRNNELLIKDRKQLEDVHKKVIKEGLKRLEKYKGTLVLNLSTEDLNSLGLKVKDGKIIGKVNPLDLMEKINSKTGGNDLIRVRNLNDALIPDDLLKFFDGNSTPASPNPIS